MYLSDGDTNSNTDEYSTNTDTNCYADTYANSNRNARVWVLSGWNSEWFAVYASAERL